MVEFEEGKSATATFIKVDKDLEISSTDGKRNNTVHSIILETKGPCIYIYSQSKF